MTATTTGEWEVTQIWERSITFNISMTASIAFGWMPFSGSSMAIKAGAFSIRKNRVGEDEQRPVREPVAGDADPVLVSGAKVGEVVIVTLPGLDLGEIRQRARDVFVPLRETIRIVLRKVKDRPRQRRRIRRNGEILAGRWLGAPQGEERRLIKHGPSGQKFAQPAGCRVSLFIGRHEREGRGLGGRFEVGWLGFGTAQSLFTVESHPATAVTGENDPASTGLRQRGIPEDPRADRILPAVRRRE